MSKINNPTKVITGPNTRWSYANVWQPKSINGGAPKYSVSLIIPKSDTVTVDKVKAAIKAAYEEGESKLKAEAASKATSRAFPHFPFSRHLCVTVTQNAPMTLLTLTLILSTRIPLPHPVSWTLTVSLLSIPQRCTAVFTAERQSISMLSTRTGTRASLAGSITFRRFVMVSRSAASPEPRTISTRTMVTIFCLKEDTHHDTN